ncbi:5-methyltetrahydropteroyltriglutamate--homocysteine S-methyltransferase [Rhodococcus rhodochrous]|uniref:5-methyltetrahydropteroyltriglutamate--homocysteine methyltransferase n=1 Tax=Rhodococcus rhodochrous TaxID=1829 RepID=A0AA46WSY9_RHORH|nr:5-methyltetrahydropteroyltriglutamate--homocysteine S-methyltransferase [Rhodococcus rhodochrous]UZF43006.1 5-methyltetrahydropteroyltriglutamate--homocysteine S-methyltransferase [Rhodococcus rhodochrous]
MSAPTASLFTATVLGSARIGPNRELKKGTEAYWAGRLDRSGLESVAAHLRADTWSRQHTAGLDSIPVGTFSFYDHVLDTAVMLGALPARVAGIADDLDRYFAAARGTDDITPLEMTKWFDTNYHYLVPEIGPDTVFELDATKILGEIAQARELGVPARPVVLGPLTFLLLSKPVDGQGPLLDRVDELVPLYLDLLAQLADTGVDWVQLDEPALVRDLDSPALDAIGRVYNALVQAPKRPAILVASYFGHLGPALARLARTGVEGLAVDLVAGSTTGIAGLPELADKLIVAGVVDGRNVWRTDLEQAMSTLATLLGSAAAVAVSSSCSLLHVPYTIDAEPGLDESLRTWLAFGDEKIGEIVTLATALREGRDAVADRLDAARTALQMRATDPRLRNDRVRGVLASIPADRRRTPADRRREIQRTHLDLPLLPTTTIGSYPQTTRIRLARAALRTGEIDHGEYVRQMRDEIADVVALQEELGLDVLVHGEPERNDMVQYFAEQLDGFFATANGWVQSYGTRCVRPPILYGDVARRGPMTVEWIVYAQSLTDKPVKGMLTGPVTILAWSFVRDDQPLAETADQIALAIRDETVDLQAAGVRIIQVDEPALRELLPLRASEQPDYLKWAVGAFRLATSGVADSTQIHTHLCYSEFGEVIEAIAELDADVTSIEAARSHMEVLDDLDAVGFDLGVGPGVYDIHSPRVPSEDEITASLRKALQAVPAERLWVNPDCGLKTRGTTEVTASLANLVTAAATVRAELNR